MIDASPAAALAAALPAATRLAIAVLVYLSCAALLLTSLDLWPRVRFRGRRPTDARDGMSGPRDPVTSERR